MELFNNKREIFDEKLISLQYYIAKMAHAPVLDIYSPRALSIIQRLDSYYPYHHYLIPQIDMVLHTPIHIRNYLRIISSFENLQKTMTWVAQDITWHA